MSKGDTTPITCGCGRCGGSGRFSFNLQHGTVCFGCNGSGKTTTTLAKQQALAKKREVAAALAAARNIAGAAAWVAMVEKYQDDPRLGSAILERMARSSAVESEAYRLLRDIDAGKKVHSSVIENLGNNAAVVLNVPYAKRALAKELGAKWESFYVGEDRHQPAWVWPECKLPLPAALLPFVETETALERATKRSAAQEESDCERHLEMFE